MDILIFILFLTVYTKYSKLSRTFHYLQGILGFLYTICHKFLTGQGTKLYNKEKSA